VLVVLGSPRKRGNSALLAAQIASGAKRAGATISTTFLQALQIQPCRGCWKCRKAGSTFLRDVGKLCNLTQTHALSADCYSPHSRTRPFAFDRFILLGLSTSLRLLVVCHCYRANDQIIRIISARKATKPEAAIYADRWNQ
jgi:uncharacterized DUF497 family protein